MRDFFIYGYKVRNDFKRKSSRTYDDEKRRVESWLENNNPEFLCFRVEFNCVHKTLYFVKKLFGAIVGGTEVRNDFKRKSSRTYDDEKRRVESWLGNFLRYEDSARGRKISICVDSGHIHENPLYQAYYSKSFTDNDIQQNAFGALLRLFSAVSRPQGYVRYSYAS